MKGKKEGGGRGVMGLAEDQGQPGKGSGSEGGGQTRGETDLTTFIIGCNLATV